MHVKAYCKKIKIRKDGTAPIYLLLRDKSDKLISTGKYVNPKYFDNDEGVVKTGEGTSQKLNAWLGSEKQKLNQIILDIQNLQQEVTFDGVLQRYTTSSHVSFIDFCRKELKEIAGSISEGNLKNTKYNIDKLERYASDLSFGQLDTRFLQRYQYYLSNVHIVRAGKDSEEIGQKVNTTAGDFRTIRKMVTRAIKVGLMKNSPFTDFCIKTEETEIEFLTLEEIIALHDLLDSGKLPRKLWNTLHYFLRACYTGVRLGDVRKYGVKDIIDNFLVLRMGKTQRIVRVPLSERARRLFYLENPIMELAPLKQSNSRLNEDLRECLALAKIEKYLTYHCSRHSFAVNSLILGIDLKVISTILGHKSIKTTEIYAKVVDTVKEKQMKAWDNIGKLKTQVKPRNQVLAKRE